METEQPNPPKPPRKNRKLTPLQNRLVKNIAKGMTQTDAAIAAGYSEKNAGQAAHQALQAIERKAPSALERNGLTDDSVIENYLLPALNATSRQAGLYKTKFRYSEPMINWQARLKALDVYCRISGSYKSDQMGSDGKVQILIVNNAHRPPWEKEAEVKFKANGNGST